MDELACHYANALYDLAGKHSKEYGEALAKVKETLNTNEELNKVLRSFSVSIEEKQKVVESVFSDAKYPHIAAFLKVVVAYHRINKINEIEAAYHSLVNADNGVKEGVVYSAMALSSQEKQAMEEALGKKLGCKVELKNVIDAGLLGGAKVALDGKVYDGTLRNKLNELHAQLKKGGKAQ